MLIDAAELDDGAVVETDLCIVGAGAAGITLARELAGGKLSVCLMESGGFQLDAPTQMLYRGTTAGYPYFPLEGCRLRYFGGSTNHWGGFCRPLDPMDFRRRDWVAHSGWPIGFDDLDPYYRKAHEICQLDRYDFSAAAFADRKRPVFPLPPERMLSGVFQVSPPTRFGQVYRDEVVTAPNVDTYLHANAVELQSGADADHVTAVRFATLGGKRFSVKAQRYVLALGGIENPRLLLASRGSNPRGLGNDHDQVGRFFMDHPILETGTVMLEEKAGSHLLYRGFAFTERNSVNGFMTLPEARFAEEGLPNFGFKLGRRTEASEAVRSLKAITGSLSEGEWPDEFTRHLMAVVSDLEEVAASAYQKFQGRSLVKAVYWMEPTPNPDSRVTLGEETDALGVPRTHLDWRFDPADVGHMHRSLELVGRELGAAALGRVHLDFSPDPREWPENMTGSFHHMGTTRMHDSPRHGVTNADCRVHGVDNLYVAGSSVFTTAGHANPTLTIVALAARLAEHLDKEVPRV